VVEDNLATRKALVESLGLLDYQALEATHGGEALQLLEQNRGIALVLSDVIMPEMSGMALFQILKQRRLDVPMVMLSGHPLEGELESLQAQGLNGWLPKPPGLNQLAEAVGQALKRNGTAHF
jgi:CheY-like chemotaxis protein